MPENPLPPLHAPASRFTEIFIGLLALASSGVLAYFGARGVWLFLNGSTAAPASPLAFTIGLGVGIWGGYAGIRMIFGLQRDRVLVPNPLLYVGGVSAILGAVLFAFLGGLQNIKAGSAVGAVGVAAILLARRRRRGATLGESPGA